MSGVIHNIKCWPDVFEEMRAGRKTAEFRYNDRGYKAGDLLLIREWDTSTGAYTHREITRLITHVLDGGFGMPAGYAMLSLSRMTTQQDSVDVERLRTATEAARDILERYIGFLHNMPSDELELHPYIPEVEDAYDRCVCALALTLPITQRDEQGGVWRDMADAPRDGTIVLLFSQDENMVDAGYWSRLYAQGGHVAGEGHWETTGADHWQSADVTHWMPLPSGPSIRRLSIEQGDQDGGAE